MNSDGVPLHRRVGPMTLGYTPLNDGYLGINENAPLGYPFSS